MAYAVFWSVFYSMKNDPISYHASPDDLEQMKLGLKLFTEGLSPSIPKPAKKIFDKQKDIAVVYDFEFDITVQNVVGGSVGWSDPFGRNLQFGTISASLDSKRRNKRNFRIEETYGLLLKNLPRGCADDKQLQVWDNKRVQAYPITNSLGLTEIVLTFQELSQMNLLSAPADSLTSSKDSKKTFPRIVDEIKFTTKISGGISSEIQFGAVGDRLKLTPINATTDNSREDVHTLIIAVGSSPTGNATAAIANASGGIDERLQRNGLRVLENFDELLRR